jgi:hypothetical protein
MSTKRVPLHRRPGTTISDEAVRLFAAMEALECTCPEPDEHGWRVRCAGCKERWRLDSKLHDELRLRPWETCIEDPAAGNPEPPGTHNAARWRPDEGARRRYRDLKAAAVAAGLLAPRRTRSARAAAAGGPGRGGKAAGAPR